TLPTGYVFCPTQPMMRQFTAPAYRYTHCFQCQVRSGGEIRASYAAQERVRDDPNHRKGAVGRDPIPLYPSHYRLRRAYRGVRTRIIRLSAERRRDARRRAAQVAVQQPDGVSLVPDDAPGAPRPAYRAASVGGASDAQHAGPRDQFAAAAAA